MVAIIFCSFRIPKSWKDGILAAAYVENLFESYRDDIILSFVSSWTKIRIVIMSSRWDSDEHKAFIIKISSPLGLYFYCG